MSSKVDFVRQNLDNKLLNGVLVDTVVNEILRNPTMELWQLLEQLDYMHTTVNLVTLFSGEYSLECFNKLSQKMTVDQLFKLWDKNKDNHVFERLIEKLVQEPNRRKVFDVCCSLMHLRDDPSFYLLMLKDHENELSSGLVNLKSQSEIKNYTKEFFARLESVSSKARCSMFQVWCQLQPDHELQFMFYQFLPFDPEAQDRLLQILIDDHVLQIRNDDPSKEKLQFLESLYLKMTVRLAECSQKMILLHPEAVMKRVESLLELQSIALNQDLFQLYEKQDLAPFLDCLVQWDLDPKFFAFVDNRLNKLLNTKISGLVDHLSSFLTKKTKKARTSTKTRTVCQLLALCLKHLDDLPLYKSVFESLDFNQDNSLVLVQLMHNESFCRDNLSYKWLKTQDLGHQVICLFAKSIYRTDDKQVKKLTKLLKPKTQEDLLPVLTHLHVFGQYLEPETVRGWVKRFCGYLSKNDPAQNLPCTMVLFHQEFYESKLVHESISQVLSECDWTLDLVKHLLFFPLKYLDSQLIESKIFQINNLELKLKMLARHCTKQVEWIPYSGYDNFYQEYMNRAVSILKSQPKQLDLWLQNSTSHPQFLLRAFLLHKPKTNLDAFLQESILLPEHTDLVLEVVERYQPQNMKEFIKIVQERGGNVLRFAKYLDQEPQLELLWQSYDPETVDSFLSSVSQETFDQLLDLATANLDTRKLSVVKHLVQHSLFKAQSRTIAHVSRTSFESTFQVLSLIVNNKDLKLSVADLSLVFIPFFSEFEQQDQVFDAMYQLLTICLQKRLKLVVQIIPVFLQAFKRIFNGFTMTAHKMEKLVRLLQYITQIVDKSKQGTRPWQKHFGFTMSWLLEQVYTIPTHLLPNYRELLITLLDMSDVHGRAVVLQAMKEHRPLFKSLVSEWEKTRYQGTA